MHGSIGGRWRSGTNSGGKTRNLWASVSLEDRPTSQRPTLQLIRGCCSNRRRFCPTPVCLTRLLSTPDGPHAAIGSPDRPRSSSSRRRDVISDPAKRARSQGIPIARLDLGVSASTEDSYSEDCCSGSGALEIELGTQMLTLGPPARNVLTQAADHQDAAVEQP